jgi:hypothetical protein
VFVALDLHDAAIVAQQSRHSGDDFALEAFDVDLDGERLVGRRLDVVGRRDLDGISVGAAGTPMSTKTSSRISRHSAMKFSIQSRSKER